MKKLNLFTLLLFLSYSALHAQTVSSVDPSSFFEVDNLRITTVTCTLSDGTSTTCYKIETNTLASDHTMGPWCPDNISDGAEAGGIWLENGEVHDVDGAFIENLATFYSDDTWLMYDANGDIYVTETEDDCVNAANPNVGEAYQNFCVECLPSYITDVTNTWVIPITPVLQEEPTPYNTAGGGGPPAGGGGPPAGGGGPGGGGPPAGGAGDTGIPSTRGVALNGVEFSAPAPVNNILSAYTIAPFDDAGGHINVNQGYHYHAATGISHSVEQSDGHSSLIGYAMDGNGIYARMDANGNEPTDLDECRGHTDAIRGYHYHIDAAGNNNFINCLAGAYVVESGEEVTDNTGGNTGDDTGGNTGGDTGGNTGGDTGGNTGGVIMSPALAEIIANYPWLEGVLDTENCCNNKSVTVFDFGGYAYIYVEPNTNCSINTSKLYFGDGACWCIDGTGLDCLNAYGLDLTLGNTTYMCEDASNGEEPVDDNMNIDPAILGQFPWLSDVVSPIFQQVEIINAGAFKFVYVTDCAGEMGHLYFETGQFYCMDSPGYDCLTAYGFTNLPSVTVSSCEGGGMGMGEGGEEEMATIQASFFNSSSLLSFSIVDCELDNGSTTKCYELTFSSNPVENGPYCPSTIDEIAGVGVYDGDTNPGFQVLKRTLWEAMEADGYDIVNEDGSIRITDPGGGGGMDAAAASCLQATPDDDLILTMILPVTPEILETPNEIGMVEHIGASIDGIPFSGHPPTVANPGNGAIPAIDPCGGHIDPSGYYHLHFGAEEINNVLDAYGITELSCTNYQQSETALIGFAKDGFPIYASKETDGSLPTDLDQCGGHVGPTAEFPAGIYHYHVSSTLAPNLPPCIVGASVANSLSIMTSDGEVVGPGAGGGGGAGGGPPGGGGGPPGGGGGGGGAAGEIINSGSVDVTSVVMARFKNNFTEGVTVQVNDDNSISISSTGLPDHKSPYWGEGHEMYEPFPGDNRPNVNTTMTTHNYVMTIPALPGEASEKEVTTLGAVGMALNGVPLYNDYEGGGILSEAAWGTFDASGAHPGPGEDYHYHVEGAYLSIDESNLIGFMRDGFPVYGRKDMDGSYPDDLDENGGHVGMTPDFPEPIYHYHISSEVYSNSGLYIIKSGAYHGTKGTFAQ